MPKIIIYNQKTKIKTITSAVFCLLFLLSFIAPASILAKESGNSTIDSIVVVYRKSDQKIIASDIDRSADEEIKAVVHDFGGKYDDYEAIFISPKPNIKNGVRKIDLIQDSSGKITKAEIVTFTDDEIKEQRDKEKLERDKQKEQNPGFDLAENYEIVEQVIEAGDVVSISDNGLLKKSNTPYDSKLMGIISTNPGIVLGGNDNVNKNKKPVALSGRVPVKVSTENGPIAIGDPITSSFTPGVGMKATAAGRVIGIALESLSDTDFENCGIENSLKIVNCELKIGRILIFVNPHWQGNDLSVQENSSGQLVNLDPEQLRTGLASLGLVVNPNGTLTVDTLRARKVALEKLEVKDQVTGNIYCTWIENGEWKKILSDCDSFTLSPVEGFQLDATAEATLNPSTSFTVSDVELLGAGNTQNNAETTTASEFQPTPEPAPSPEPTPAPEPELAPSGSETLGGQEQESLASAQSAEPAPEPAPLDTTAPVITLLGEATIQLEVGATYTDEGASATDDVDGDITANIAAVNPVDTSAQGTYAITYNVSDSAGNQAEEVTRTVNVVAPAPPPDTTPPVVTLLGEASVTLEAGTAYTDAGATATDDVDGDLTSSIVVVNSVDTTTPGSYAVTYSVSDAAGNAADPVTRTVTVTEPASEPVSEEPTPAPTP